MNSARSTMGILAAIAILFGGTGISAQDWPQWRGPNRDAKAVGFKAPAMWPKELSKKWQVTVGDGVATPALVGGKLYVFSRQEANEMVRCLDAETGKEIWQDKYEAQGATGPSSGFAGPRSSPTVADGKVVTLGVRGMLSCLDANTGMKLWRHETTGDPPRFFTSCSPIVVNNLCIVQLGGEGKGSIAAYDLATGNEKWTWSEDGTAYASPVINRVDGADVIIAETAKNIVAIGLSDGKLLWQTPFAVTGRGYNACTPIVEGATVIFAGSGRGTKAVKLEKSGEQLAAKEVWTSPDNSVQFNTPVLKDGLVFGLSDRDSLFCIDAQSGKTAWTSPLTGRGRLRGYGSIVDAGSVLFALNPSAELVVFEPTDKEFKQLAKYTVSDKETFAYPVVAGNRIFVKDQDSLTLWTIE